MRKRYRLNQLDEGCEITTRFVARLLTTEIGAGQLGGLDVASGRDHGALADPKLGLGSAYNALGVCATNRVIVAPQP